MEITNVSSRDKDFLQLVQALDMELENRYDDQHKFKPFNKIGKNACVVVAYDEGVPVACGCFRPGVDGEAEIKRMYTRPSHRGRGIALLVLSELEAWAKSLGVRRVVLETGVKQPEAFAAYTRAGYSLIANYSPYEDSPYSLCMEKMIG